MEIKKYKGIEYLVYTHPRMGHFCGYVRLPDNHKFVEALSKSHEYIGFFGKKQEVLGYDDLPIKVHGGLTFGDHVQKDDNPQLTQGFTKGWWIGWDYAHAGDFVPMASLGMDDEKRWTAEEVEEDCKSVIDQILNYGN